MELRWLVYKAWRHFRRDQALPLDIYDSLLRAGISPEAIEEAFSEGYLPGDLVQMITTIIDYRGGGYGGVGCLN